MRLVGFLISLVAFLSSCGGGPRVTWCIPDDNSYACSNGDKNWESPLANQENWGCLEARHVQRLLSYCRDGVLARVTWCVVLTGGTDVVCPSGDIVPVNNDNQGWTCMSPTDIDRFIHWCTRGRG